MSPKRSLEKHFSSTSRRQSAFLLVTIISNFKSCLLIGIIFLLIQGVSELLKSYWAAKKGEWPGEEKK